MIRADIAVVGGGIAGAAAAAHLAVERSVVLLEREEQPGYHASGRSAALFSEAYGNETVRALSVASRAFFEAPPDGFAAHPLLAPRGAMHVGGPGDEDVLAAILAETRALVPSIRGLSPAEALALVPALRPDGLVGGVFEPDAMDIDTHALLSGFLRLFRARGGTVLTRAELTGIERQSGLWSLATRAGPVEAAILVNAAGAWADTVAELAGVPARGVEPRRRTAFLFEPPAGLETRGWPLVASAREDVYFKPEAGLLFGSPADETPSPATDAQADDIDVATAIDRIERLAAFPVRRVVRRWAGLRSFAPDRTPVVGFDPEADGFFWLAGQGGYGFQTAPALGRTAAALLLRDAMPDDVQALGVDAAQLSPRRLATACPA